MKLDVEAEEAPDSAEDEALAEAPDVVPPVEEVLSAVTLNILAPVPVVLVETGDELLLVKTPEARLLVEGAVVEAVAEEIPDVVELDVSEVPVGCDGQEETNMHQRTE